ncbi:MAG: FecR domain-containing protein [Rhodocyclaceae bacterium]|nr:FecR domain-containing protein [Rhodocyclaceae bacterium]MBX3668701.1 FecR domain-containing protein [Rhodocyclaceae bacterium]
MQMTRTQNLLLILGLIAATGSVQAQNKVGEVSYAQGIATAQRAGEPARFVAKGDALIEGDVITTSNRGYAVLNMDDGAKMTLRPGTVFAVEKYEKKAGQESAVMRLFRGGFRAITGLIGKRNPSGVAINTVTATIGIRGTEFDARLCTTDCRQESQQFAQNSATPSAPPAPQAVARVVQLNGSASASNQGQSRSLETGAPLFEGDIVRTAEQASAVLGFRDESKMSLNPNTALRIDKFSYLAQDKADNMLFRLLRGGLRAFTGLIGKRDPHKVQFQTTVATIGIRGTGLDMNCEGPCADPSEGNSPATNGNGDLPGDGLFVYDWEGNVFVEAQGRNQPLGENQTVLVDARGLIRLLAGVPEFMRNMAAPRPDQVPVDWGTLFNAADEGGLYVAVRDGAVELRAGGQVVALGPRDAGFLSEFGTGGPVRLERIPEFMRNDPFPLPNRFDPNNARILQFPGASTGQPGQDLCTM